MTKRQVVKDSAGTVINIGPWDYVEMEEASSILDALGNPVVKVVKTNPLPNGAYEDEADIIEGWDGGLYVKGDPRAERT